MTFAELLTQLMEFLNDNLITPILDYIYYDLGYSIPIIKLGFGSIEWFAMELDLLLFLILGLMVSITALVLTWRFVKMLSNIVRRLFGGVKK